MSMRLKSKWNERIVRNQQEIKTDMVLVLLHTIHWCISNKKKL